jgi:metallo-beta-lactamase class B
MKSCLLLTAAFTILGLVAASAQTGEAEMHRRAAKTAAGTLFPGILAATCVSPDPATVVGDGSHKRPDPDRSTWYAPPARMFDNLYWIGTRIHSAWALKTSGGIIIIDTLYNYAVEPEMVEGLKALGLNPADVKYVIVSHAHGDHDEGAHLFQQRYGAHVVMGAPDWDSIEKQTAMPGGPPKRDISVTADRDITLGDTTVHVLTSPGHTPGTLSFIFPVKDRGRTLTAVYSGGTGFNFPHDVAHYDIYAGTQRKMAAAAAKAGATVLFSNHSVYDDAFDRSRLVKLRAAGEPHPYEIGTAAVGRYFKVGEECALAARADLAH